MYRLSHLTRPGSPTPPSHPSRLCFAACPALSPVDAGEVDDDVDHVAAELVRLHVHRRRVGGDVDLGDDVEQKRLLRARVLWRVQAASHQSTFQPRRVPAQHRTAIIARWLNLHSNITTWMRLIPEPHEFSSKQFPSRGLSLTKGAHNMALIIEAHIAPSLHRGDRNAVVNY